LGEHCTGIAEVVGSNPAQSLKFFSGLCSSSVTAAFALIAVMFNYSSPLNFPVAVCLKTEKDKNLFIKIFNRYGALSCFIFSVVSSSDDITSIHV